MLVILDNSELENLKQMAVGVLSEGVAAFLRRDPAAAAAAAAEHRANRV